MACVDMYNSEQHKGHHHHCAPMSPRISFSNDFVESHHHQNIIKQERSSSRETPPVSSDFEFSVTNYSMMSADELFFKGKLLPFRDNNNSSSNQMQRTLREELLVDDDVDDDNGVSLRPPKGSSTRWKGLLGLKRSHIGFKKADKSSEASVERVGDHSKRSYEETHVSNSTSQELLNEGGPSCRDLEIGI